MRASPRISVLGEGGDPYIAGNGPWKDHKTVVFSWRWLPFSLMVTDVRDLDNSGRAGHRLNLVQALKLRCLHSRWSSCLRWRRHQATDCFPWRPTNIGKLGPNIFWLFPQNSFCKDCNSFSLTGHSIHIALVLNPQPSWLFPQTLSASLFPQNSFRKLLEIKSGNSGAPF